MRSKLTIAHVIWRCSKLSIFSKKSCFFSKEHVKVFRNTKDRYFPSEFFPKVIIAYASSKRSKLELFWKTMTFFAEKSLKNFKSSIWHFLTRLRVRLSYCFGILQTIKFLGFLEKKCCFWKDSFWQNRCCIFLLACVSNSLIAQENLKRSTSWDLRESRLVIWKKWLNFLIIAVIGNISLECVSNGIFAQKNLKKFKLWIFLG